MIHYNLLKLKSGAPVDEVYARCRQTYAQLEAALDFLHDARVVPCATVRDSNADLMMVMRIDAPERLGDYLRHPLHSALAQETKQWVEARLSFDEE